MRPRKGGTLPRPFPVKGPRSSRLKTVNGFHAHTDAEVLNRVHAGVTADFGTGVSRPVKLDERNNPEPTAGVHTRYAHGSRQLDVNLVKPGSRSTFS